MADPFRKWAQGDEWHPSASQLNAWTDAARLAQQAQRGQPTDLGTPAPAFTPLRIHNATGERIPALGVISFAAPMVTPTISEERFTALPTLNAIKPAAPLDRFAICQRAMEIDEVADNVAMLLGVVPCRITGTGTKAQATTNNMTRLQAGSTGHPIIYQESGTGERFALVYLSVVASECVKKYQLFIIGSVASGSFPLPVQVSDGSGGWVTENVTINYNSTTAQTKTAIEGHSLIDPDTVVVTGSSNLVSANHVIIMPSDTRLGSGGDAELDSSALVRSGIIQPKVYLLECCS